MVWKSPPKDPHHIGKYAVLGLLGKGAMGAVYKGCDPGTGQVVAIKLLKPEVAAEPLLVKRFEQEFLVARSLTNPHAVRALDYGAHDGLPFLVMEFVDGDDLWVQVKQRGPLPEARAVELIAQVAAALHDGHTLGVIHRDVKPDNILILADGSAKLADFGLAKDQVADVNLTQQADILGTPNFMAPEQFDDPTKVDRRCDVYALAATTYMLVTGVLPFEARNLHATIRKKLQAELVSPRKLAPGLSERAEQAILAGMHLDPDRRPGSCLEFVAKLRGSGSRRRSSGMLPRLAGGTSGQERRTALRFQCRLESCCRPVGGALDTQWESRIRNVSARGIGLEVSRRFEPGAVLMLELHGATGVLNRLVVNVVRVEKADAKRWFIGCRLHCPLSRHELRTLQEIGSPAASGASA
jgi:serine/threonine protein kinase